MAAHPSPERQTKALAADTLAGTLDRECLRALSEIWQAADVQSGKADPSHAFYKRIVWARFTPEAHAHGMAFARPQVVMARPTGVGRALATYEIPIEGRDEWLAAARRLA